MIKSIICAENIKHFIIRYLLERYHFREMAATYIQKSAP